MQEAPERETEEKKREAAWAESNRSKNEAALRLMRSFMPTDIRMLTNEQVRRHRPARRWETTDASVDRTCAVVGVAVFIVFVVIFGVVVLVFVVLGFLP